MRLVRARHYGPPPPSDGGVDQDTEINGATLGDTFTDISWQPAMVDHMLSPPFAVFPDLEVSLPDITIVAEPDIVVPSTEPDLVVR